MVCTIARVNPEFVAVGANSTFLTIFLGDMLGVCPDGVAFLYMWYRVTRLDLLRVVGVCSELIRVDSVKKKDAPLTRWDLL